MRKKIRLFKLQIFIVTTVAIIFLGTLPSPAQTAGSKKKTATKTTTAVKKVPGVTDVTPGPSATTDVASASDPVGVNPAPPSPDANVIQAPPTKQVSLSDISSIAADVTSAVPRAALDA